MEVKMNEPGYEKLASVFQDAYQQAALGKGKERHADATPFEEQSTQQIMRLLQTSDGAIHQAIKKLVEARRLPPAHARAERLGAIVYIASAIIADELRFTPSAITDSEHGPAIRWFGGRCPVGESRLVQIKIRGEQDLSWSNVAQRAGDLEWSHDVVPDHGDIVLYRLVS